MKRRLIRGALIAGVVLAVLAITIGARASHILAGYKAKMLCSEVLVAGRDRAAVLTDLNVDDLWPLRLFSASLSSADRSTTASLPFGLSPRHARFQPGTGCVLQHGDRTAMSTTTSDDRSTRADDSVAIDPALNDVVNGAFLEPDPAHPRRTRAVVVVRNGRIVAEHYADGFGPDSPFPGWSMTKSALNALVGILVSQGKLTLEQPAPVPEWRDDQRRRITIDHLLRMSSGLDFVERISLPRFDVMSMLFEAPDMASFAADAQLRAEPGARWQYASGSSLILSGIVRRILGDDNYRRFPKQALFDRLGMSHAVIEQDASGTFVASSYMYATAREWGRLGSLFAQDGTHDGKEILPSWWIAYSRTPAPADPAQSYGAHFWLTLPDTYNARHTPLPADAFHMAGHEGQFVTIVPSKHAVIVRLGKTRYPGAWDQSRFVAEVLGAMP